VFWKMVLNVARSGFGTSLAKLTQGTLRPLAKLQRATPPPESAPELVPASEPELDPELEVPPELDAEPELAPELDAPEVASVPSALSGTADASAFDPELAPDPDPEEAPPPWAPLSPDEPPQASGPQTAKSSRHVRARITSC
jgi:hypothetical protein